MSCRRCPVAMIGTKLSDLSHPEQHGTESGDDIACGIVHACPQMSLHLNEWFSRYSCPLVRPSSQPTEPSAETAFVKHDGAE